MERGGCDCVFKGIIITYFNCLGLKTVGFGNVHWRPFTPLVLEIFFSWLCWLGDFLVHRQGGLLGLNALLISMGPHIANDARADSVVHHKKELIDAM